MKKITKDEAVKLIKYIDIISGISLDLSKTYLLESRLSFLLEEFDCSNYDQLYTKSVSDKSNKIASKIISSISTNETSFFRDTNVFDLLKFKVLPDHFDYISKTKLSPSIRIWSAACAMGQEVYSIAMCIKELLYSTGRWNIRIVGTDISDAAILYSSKASYNALEVKRGLSQERLNKFFKPDKDRWRINDEVRALAYFERINLLNSVTHMGKFDIIFCRNVAIYFSMENRKKLFDRLATQLNPNGALIIGATEYLNDLSNRYKRYEYHNATMYKLAQWGKK